MLNAAQNIRDILRIAKIKDGKMNILVLQGENNGK